jgi:hypothetical protein
MIYQLPEAFETVRRQEKKARIDALTAWPNRKKSPVANKYPPAKARTRECRLGLIH